VYNATARLGSNPVAKTLEKSAKGRQTPSPTIGWAGIDEILSNGYSQATTSQAMAYKYLSTEVRNL
jgi:hypothetical protein